MDSGPSRVARTMNINYDYDEEEDLDEEIERLMKQKRQVNNKRSR
jgi:hypothetical protein